MAALQDAGQGTLPPHGGCPVTKEQSLWLVVSGVTFHRRALPYQQSGPTVDVATLACTHRNDKAQGLTRCRGEGCPSPASGQTLPLPSPSPSGVWLASPGVLAGGGHSLTAPSACTRTVKNAMAMEGLGFQSDFLFASPATRRSQTRNPCCASLYKHDTRTTCPVPSVGHRESRVPL